MIDAIRVWAVPGCGREVGDSIEKIIRRDSAVIGVAEDSDVGAVVVLVVTGPGKRLLRYLAQTQPRPMLSRTCCAVKVNR